MHAVYGAASTVTGIDYSSMFSAASSELLVLLPPVILVGVGITVALWAVKTARKIFTNFAK